MNSTANLDYFKQEQDDAWSPNSSDTSAPHSPNSISDPDYNVYHVPRGYDVLLVPMKLEDEHSSDTQATSSPGAPLNNASKPMDIPKSDKNYIPRPKNCFMAYREHIKEKFLADNPGMNNKVVSIHAANMWNNEPEDVKEYWRERAKQLKLEHKLKYPDYKFKPQKKKQNLKTPGNTKAITKVNGRKKSDPKIVFTDGYANPEDGRHIYPVNLEVADDQDEIYYPHLQKKALFGHYRASSVDSASSWTSDSTVSTPLLSPFVGSPASLSPPSIQSGNHLGRSALRYEAAHVPHNGSVNGSVNNNLLLSSSPALYIDQLNQLYNSQMDINARGNLPVDDGFILDSSSYDSPILKAASSTSYFQCSSPTVEMSANDYDLMAMGHYPVSPIEEESGYFNDFDGVGPTYNQNVFDSSFGLSSSLESQSTHDQHYAFALETPRRNSQQLLSEFQNGLKQLEMISHGLLTDN
ncbi:16087_t:CDS:2 [Gigaspora margarita]|uniref:16087_t:CDS:1 n=1 Tax=Gigaspora margarita TaxID=4874 RepID=A0ABM8W188_GIGMA|nr:16087_t:CDS:2 [Gigaspora margarita]